MLEAWARGAGLHLTPVTVRDGRVASIARFDSLGAALAAAWLTDADEARGGG